MRRNLKILCFVFLAAVNAQTGLSQAIAVSDSLKLKKTESTGSADKQDPDQNKDWTRNGSQNMNQNNNGNRLVEDKVNQEGTQSIKQVRSARPDMSKARGARPPQIERPSGSRIPKGVGRAGGAIKPGKK
jgi:flagellar biosynthesis component FlhA